MRESLTILGVNAVRIEQSGSNAKGIGAMSFKRMVHSACAVLGLSLLLCGQAAATLTVTPTTWNVIGLDSNSPTTGPKYFPVGARACSSVATTNVSVSFVWDSANANINLRSGSLSSISIPSLAAGACSDAYFEAGVNQVAGAYDTTRRYHITAHDGVTADAISPTRELYVEHLISQNRNSVSDVKLDGASIPAGGSMNLMVGNTYTIELDGGTATQGYNQFEAFISFPNTIFQILSVSTSYSADNSPYVLNPNDKLYADACLWVNDVTSPNYLSCVGGDYKAGGQTVVTTYTVKILGGAGTSQTLNTLLYDFSGSSFHYNGDYSAGARIANIISATVAKSFAPKNVKPGAAAALTFTITNPGSTTLTGVNFTDVFPSGMSIANTTTSTVGCSASSTPALVAPVGGGSFSAGAVSAGFSNISIAGNSSCSITINVTAASAGSYNNTTTDLFINTTTDAGSTGSDSLVVTILPAPPSNCSIPVTLATFSMPVGGTTPPTIDTGTLGSGVSFANAAAHVTGATGASQNTTTAGVTTNAWAIIDAWPTTSTAPGVATGGTIPYFQFSVDSSNYGGVAINFRADLEANGDWGSATNDVWIYSSTDGTTFTLDNPGGTGIAITKGSWQPSSGSFAGTAAASGSGTTWFRIAFDNRNSAKTTSTAALDNVSITGCPRPTAPTLSKSFSPASIPTDTTVTPAATVHSSTLTFTLANPNASSLGGVAFSDTLPTGLVIAAPNGLAGPSCSSGNLTGQTITATTGSNTISLSGGTLSASAASCTFSVNVQGQVAGAYTNVSNSITSTSTGANSSSSGYGSYSLTVVDPPAITKLFGAGTLFTGSTASLTTSLTFAISNPNLSTTLTGVAFTDTLPAGLVVASPNGLSAVSCSSGSLGATPTAAAASSAIGLSGGSLSPGATCTFSLNVTGTTTGLKTNTVTIGSTNGGTGNTATASLNVKDPSPSINLLKQVSTSSSGPWNNFLSVAPTTALYYKFTVENTGDLTFNPFSVSDPVLAGSAADPAGCTWSTTNSPTTLPSLPVATATVDPIATCVVGSIAALAGDNLNTATAHGSYNGTDHLSAASSADYIGATAGFSLLKEIGTSATGPWSSSITVASSSSLYYKFTLVNTGSVALSSVSVTDPQVSTSSCTFSDPLAVSDATTCVVGPVTASGTAGTYTNTATGYGTYDASPYQTAPSSASYTSITALPDLTIAKSHTGNFSQGQTGATYTVTVSNASGSAATTGTVSVTDTAPSGMTVTAMSGTGWTCTTLPTCTRTDALAGGASYPAITVTVSIAANATTPLVNSVAVSLSGQSESNTGNNSATDSTVIGALPDLTIAKSHTGNFSQGQTGATYTVTVSNLGTAATSGTITVSDTLPAGLTYSSASGAGWSCGAVGQVVTCTSSTVIAAAGTGTAITLTVSVAANAASLITNTVGASGGGATNTPTASDPTTIASGLSSLMVAKTVYQGKTGGSACPGLNELVIVDATHVPKDITWCFAVTNTGNTYLSNPLFDDAGLNIASGGSQAAVKLRSGVFPLAPGASATWYVEQTRTTSLLNTVTVTMTPSNSGGSSLGLPTVSATSVGKTTFAYVFDPPFGIKTGQVNGVNIIRWTMVWINDNAVTAAGVILTDPPPVGMTYAGNLVCTPQGSTIVTSCAFEAPSVSYPRGRVMVVADMGPDLGATSQANANNALQIAFDTSIDNPNVAQTFQNQGADSWTPPGGPTLTGTTSAPGTSGGATTVTFVPPVVPGIPTLSEWTLLLLSGFVGMFAFLQLRRQRRSD